MANRDRFGHEIPTIEDSTMDYLDNAIKQLTGAHDDLSKENAEAAQVEYGRTSEREAAFKAQIERDDSLEKQIRRLIVRGDNLASRLEDGYGNHNLVVTWKEESDRAAELIQ